MKILFQLFVAIILIPTSLHAQSDKFDKFYKYRLIRTHACTGFYFYEDAEYSENRLACFTLDMDQASGAIEVKAWISCQQHGPDTCEEVPGINYRAYCFIDDAGPDVVQVLNKTHVLVDMQPEDCEQALNAVGTQFSVIANGRGLERWDYANYFFTTFSQQDRHCIQRSKGGNFEGRSADLEAVIEGQVLEHEEGHIDTISTDFLFNPCNLPF